MTAHDSYSAGLGMRISADVLKQLDEETVSALVGLGADLVIVIDGATVVRKIYMPDPQLREYLLANLPGKRLRDVVTEESVEKIDRMIAGEKAGAAGRGFQVNVPLEGGDDVPFELHVFEDKVLPYRLVIGHDMRQQMRQQQRLVHAQMEMESDYRELQEAEARYRTAFQVSSVALLMVDGKGKTVLDVNPAAAALLSGTAGAIAGKPLRELFRREFRDQLVDALSEARHSGVAVNLDDLVTARGEPVSASIRSYREKGLTNLIVTLRPAAQNDETGHRLGEPAGSRAMIDIASFPEAAVQTDLGGRIIAANDIFLDIVHAPSPGQVIGSNVSTWFGNSAIDIQVLFSRVAEEHMVRGFTSTLRDNLLGERPVLLSARRHPENEIIQIIVLSQPVTARKAAVAPLGAPQRADGFAHLVGKVPMKDLIRESLDVIEKICIEAALDQTNNNRASAAELLGLSRQSLYIKLRRHGLEDYLANE